MNALADATEAIHRVRSARSLRPDRPVADDLLRRLLTLASQAHSADNLQPWRFLVVRDPSQPRARSVAAPTAMPASPRPRSPLVILGYHYPHRTHWTDILARMKTEAGALASRRAASSTPRPARPGQRARSLRLGVQELHARLGHPDDRRRGPRPGRRADRPLRRRPGAATTFGVPVDHSVCGLIALGHPVGESPSLGRLGLDDLCFEEHFGQPWTLGEVTP